MKGMFKVLTVFYILFPLVVVPYVANKQDNWFYLFGIVCYYMGVILVAVHQKIIFMIPLIFCLWFWYTYGFSIHDFVFFLFFFTACGALFYQLANNAKYFINRTLPENKESMVYESKLEEMNARVEEYKRQHPNEKITPEIMDVIRNEVFFK